MGARYAQAGRCIALLAVWCLLIVTDRRGDEQEVSPVPPDEGIVLGLPPDAPENAKATPIKELGLLSSGVKV